MTAPTWDRFAAELDDTRQRARMTTHRKTCLGCGGTTTSATGYCMSCQPSLLDQPPEPQPIKQGEPVQIGVDDAWPEWLY